MEKLGQDDLSALHVDSPCSSPALPVKLIRLCLEPARAHALDQRPAMVLQNSELLIRLFTGISPLLDLKLACFLLSRVLSYHQDASFLVSDLSLGEFRDVTLDIILAFLFFTFQCLDIVGYLAPFLLKTEVLAFIAQD